MTQRQARCIYCDCDRLTAVREDLDARPVIICGACGSLMLIDIGVGEDGDPCAVLRQPTQAESLEAHRDPDVKRFLDAFHIVTLEQAGAAKPKKQAKSLRSLKPGEEYSPGPITIKGPDAR